MTIDNPLLRLAEHRADPAMHALWASDQLPGLIPLRAI